MTPDTRPCHTDLFLLHIGVHEDDHYDYRERIKDWLEGDWDTALDGLPPMEHGVATPLEINFTKDFVVAVNQEVVEAVSKLFIHRYHSGGVMTPHEPVCGVSNDTAQLERYGDALRRIKEFHPACSATHQCADTALKPPVIATPDV